MRKFIKLHNENDNTVVLVKSKMIILFTAGVTDDNKRYSSIYMYDNDIDSFDVNEVPEKIINNFDTGFIKLHMIDDNNVIYINTDYISLIDNESSGGSRIYVEDKRLENICVNESPEKIESMILKMNTEK